MDPPGQSVEVLAYLARHAGQIVAKAELAFAVWSYTFVTDDSLVQCIGGIRRVLGDADHRIVETLVKRGYRLNPALVAADTVQIETIPRVAVLASDDHSTGANRGTLNNAIADGVINELAFFGEFSVVSRQPSFKYRVGGLGAGQIGDELGAQYVIEGSQQVLGGKLRVSVQLIDAKTEICLWSNSYEGVTENDFEVQSGIVRKIAASAGFQMCTHAPSLTSPDYRGAMHYFLGSRVEIQMSTPETLAFAEKMNRIAIEADPGSPYGYIGMSYINCANRLHRWVENDFELLLKRAASFADKALQLAPRNSHAHFARGAEPKEAGELDQAEAKFERSLALNPHTTNVLITGAFIPLY